MQSSRRMIFFIQIQKRKSVFERPFTPGCHVRHVMLGSICIWSWTHLTWFLRQISTKVVWSVKGIKGNEKANLIAFVPQWHNLNWACVSGSTGVFAYLDFHKWKNELKALGLLIMYHLIFEGQEIWWGIQEICKFF